MMAAVNEAIHVTSLSPADGGDERLTNDPIVVPPHLPLEEITVSTTCSGDDDDDDDLSSISVDDEIDALAEATATNTPSRPRSIFSHRAKQPACADDDVDRPSSPACVMMNMSSSSLPVGRRRSNKYSSKTYQYAYAGGVNPYEHFGIAQDYYGDEAEQQERQNKKEQQPLQESDSSLNTYERMVSGAESSNRNTNNKNNNKSSNVFNVWMSFFTKNDGTAATTTPTTRHSAPSLRDLVDRQSNKNTRNAQSDPALIKSPSKSCLRRGRFSSVVKSPPVEDDEALEDGSSSGHSDRTVVQFETNVQVFEFQRPVETWAENGWSSWFG
eukprot:CAMPEP_0113475264 /NCGR_PEP_ID=MMETSP0014_2-20120614/19026_1 /TAXON_ID=2857 /ORGANISM="Nitzschia sp." /LENGTH=326 /DNA_ID=CAMNT_0000368169 /DNA_START=257 /DNA_END=1237 /DNA_ORIENTATION=- /assembly_acc=CAM_ASM_000159